MAVLILYATIEGQTRKVAEFAAEEARKAGHEVRSVDVSGEMATVSYDGIDRVILAAPVHERRHPRPFETLIAADRQTLGELKTMLLSVSLNAAFVEGQAEANDYVVEMKMRTEFTPDVEQLVAGAVRTGEYDYFATQIVRHVVMRGREYPVTDGTQEFTDWPVLAEQLAVFLAA